MKKMSVFNSEEDDLAALKLNNAVIQTLHVKLKWICNEACWFKNIWLRFWTSCWVTAWKLKFTIKVACKLINVISSFSSECRMSSSSLLIKVINDEINSLLNIFNSWSNAKKTEELSVFAILFLFTVSMSSTLKLLSLLKRKLYQVDNEEIKIINDTKTCLCVDEIHFKLWTNKVNKRKKTLLLNSN